MTYLVRILLTALFFATGCNAAESTIIPVRSLPPNAEYCVHRLAIQDNNSDKEIQTIADALEALTSFVGENNGELLYFDWLDFQSVEFLYRQSCNELSFNVELYKSTIPSETPLTFSHLKLLTTSPRITNTGNESKLTDLGDIFSMQERYSLDQCVLRVKLAQDVVDWPNRLRIVDEISRPIRDGNMSYAFPFLAALLYDDEVFVLFNENCDRKEQVFKNAIFFLSSIENENHFKNIKVSPETDLKIIKDRFYIE